jgi:hypothetical protein
LDAGREVRLAGYAWSGTGPVHQVEVSVDGGSTWKAAALVGPAAPYAWRLWELAWKPERHGSYSLAARAVDSTGAIQPEQVEWNAKGFGNHMIQWITVLVR